MRMLSESDLHAIGSLIDVKFDEKLEPVLEAIREGFEQSATKAELVAWRAELRGEMGEMGHELMGHTDRTVSKAVGDLRAELRERDMIG